MPTRYRLLEQISFVLTTLFAFTCLGVIVCEGNPELMANLQQASMRACDAYAAC